MELRETHCHKKSRGSKSALTVEDNVLVHEQDQSRRFWKLARVHRLMSGRDGMVQRASLKVASPNH